MNRTPPMIDIAAEYVVQGWQPVPVPYRKKAPVLTGWQTIRYQKPEDAAQHFNGAPQNIGVILGAASHDLVDVDLDVPEALAFARLLLPETRRFGRASNPSSHWLYYAPTEETRKQFFVLLPDPAKKKDRTMIVELRANQHQTVFPPSVHEDSGEAILWSNNLEPVHLEFAELERLAGRVAAGAVLARAWPREKGCRHECEMALATILLRSGFSSGNAERFVCTLATIAGTEHAAQRARNVISTTEARLKSGKTLTGWRRLSGLLGQPELIGKVPDWLGYEPRQETDEERPGDEAGSTRAPAEVDTSPEWPRLDPAALYGVLGDIVRAIEPHTEADPSALLIQLFAAFGSIAGRSAYFQVEADRHYPNVFAVLVGPTSKGRKGTSKGQAMEPFKTIDEHWIKECVRSGLSSGEGLIWAVRDPIEKKEPVKEKGRIKDYETVIADHGVEDKRLLVIEPEFASTLRVLGRDGNTLSAVLRNAWDSGNLRILTKNSPAVATDAHISLIAHITADELRRYLDSTEAANGFANRFLWLCVRRSKCLPEGGEIWRVDFGGLVRRLSLAVDFARKASRIQFATDAREIWRGIYADLSEGQSGLFGAVTSRAEAQVIRLALLYALADASGEIREPHLLAALALWEYSEASARYIFGNALGDPVADEILEALKRNAEGLSRTDISGLFGRNKSAGQLGRALAVLVREGRVAVEERETEGRPAQIWKAIR